MSFRRRLTLFFLIIAVVPMVAAAVALFAIIPSSETGKSDARLAQGLRATLAIYGNARKRGELQLNRVTADPAFRRALNAGGMQEVQRRLNEVVRSGSARAIELYDPAGRRRAGAGDPAAVAFATVAPTTPEGFRIGTLALSVTTAAEFVGEAKAMTGLETRLFRGLARLASTLPERGSGAAESGDAVIEGRHYRGRFQGVAEAVGPDFRIGLFEASERLSAAVERSRLLIVGLLLTLVALAVVGAVLLVRAQQRQIAEFLDAARGLGEGDFSRRVTVVGSDEFAALATEFNRMSQQLSAKIDEVSSKRGELEEAIRSVGKAFAAGLDRQGIVDLTVSTAVQACAAEAGRVLPVDSQKLRRSFVGRADDALGKALGQAERMAIQRRNGRAAKAAAGLADGGARTPEAPGISQPGPGGEVSHVVARDVHALAAPLDARLSAGSEVALVGVLSIARAGGDFTDAERDLFAYLASQSAVSIENADLHERVKREAVTDELTGLFNLRHFHDALEGEAERNRRFGAEVGIVMLDLDDFKFVNDTYGHQQGDLVLIEVARVLRDLSREIDAPARYGGEEMAIILPQTDLLGAERLAERMRSAISDAEIRRLDGRGTFRVTASFGVASIPESAADGERVVAAADAALYRAKRSGKNRVERAEAEPASR